MRERARAEQLEKARWRQGMFALAPFPQRAAAARFFLSSSYSFFANITDLISSNICA
jgi:uncharacterized protein (DUF1330 family)